MDRSTHIRRFSKGGSPSLSTSQRRPRARYFSLRSPSFRSVRGSDRRRAWSSRVQNFKTTNRPQLQWTVCRWSPSSVLLLLYRYRDPDTCRIRPKSLKYRVPSFKLRFPTFTSPSFRPEGKLVRECPVQLGPDHPEWLVYTPINCEDTEGDR